MDSDFAVLLARAQQGDEAAAVSIWNSYYDRLVRYVRGKLKGIPRRDADEEDVALMRHEQFLRWGARRSAGTTGCQ